mgnify:CR=1|jgi:hypothetical protein|tara:strand:+ start:806 stop:1015 length:210 start_codon:yes stop_codon:yes gene_type:complete
MIPETDMDYIELYANKLKKDNSLFKQQKMLIESQLRSSSMLFRKMFGSENFKANARKYLKAVRNNSNVI